MSIDCQFLKLWRRLKFQMRSSFKGNSSFNAENKRPSNYFSIHGTISGGLVATKSNLAIEVLQQFILKALNLRGEVVFPDDFNDFKGVDGKTVVTNNTEQFSLQFGYKSTFDNATERLFKEYGEKSEGSNPDLTYFKIFMDYQNSMSDLQQSIVWGRVNKPAADV